MGIFGQAFSSILCLSIISKAILGVDKLWITQLDNLTLSTKISTEVI